MHTGIVTISLVSSLCACQGGASFADSYLYEIIAVIGIVLLILNYRVGCQKNSALLGGFAKATGPFLAKNFAWVADGAELKSSALLSNPEETTRLFEVESANSFKLRLTGRKSARFATVAVSTRRRQDFLASALCALFWPEKDRFCLEVALADLMPRGVLYVVRSRAAKKLLGEFEDMKRLCRRLNMAGLPEYLAAYSETEELVNAVMDSYVLAKFASAGAVFESLEFSDCAGAEPGRGAVLRIFGSLSGSETEQRDILAIGLTIALRAAEYSPSQRTQDKLVDNRKSFYAERNKEKRDSAMEAEKARKWDSMTEKEKQKHIEKEQNRANLKASRRMVVVKK